MYLALRYAAQFLGATATALILYALVHDGFGIPRRSIVVDAFGSACVLSVACALGALARGRR